MEQDVQGLQNYYRNYYRCKDVKLPEVYLAIKLGNTHAQAALLYKEDGRIEMLEIEDGSTLLPAKVFLFDGDQALVGREALEYASQADDDER